MQKKKIGLIFQGKAYAPEIKVYRDFLNKRGHYVNILNTSEDLTDEDIEWHFMGVDSSPKKTVRLKIHEYASLSIPPFAKCKNLMKKILNSKPDIRVFNNKFIKDEFKFKDNANELIREAGIGAQFFNEMKVPKSYDFVYLGAMDNTRKIDDLLKQFLCNFPKHTMLLIGETPQKLLRKFSKCNNLFFAGQLRYEEVPFWLQKARFGVNFVPPVYPYRFQASLKILEYCATKLPVVTTSYEWVNEFELQREARFFKLSSNLNNFQPELIESFEYKIPNVNDLTWENSLRKSGLIEFIENA